MKNTYVTKEYINSILEEKFIINFSNKEYKTSDTIEVVCKDCGKINKKSLSPKKINVNCRKCSIIEYQKRKHEDFINNRDKNIYEKFSYIKIYNINDTHIEFECPICSEDSHKQVVAFVKKPFCNSCSYKNTIKNSEKRQLIKNNFSEKIKRELGSSLVKIIDTNSGPIKYEMKCKCGNHQIKSATEAVYNVKRNNEYICSDCSRIENAFSHNLVKYYTENREKGNEIGNIYMVEMKEEYRTFFKIGVTKHNIFKRFKDYYNNFEVKNIWFQQMTNLEVSIIEKYIKKNFKEYRYTPTIDFAGKTECFTYPILHSMIKVQRLSQMGVENKQMILEADSHQNGGRYSLILDESLSSYLTEILG